MSVSWKMKTLTRNLLCNCICFLFVSNLYYQKKLSFSEKQFLVMLISFEYFILTLLKSKSHIFNMFNI
jgi:hypothetical protein